MSVRGVRVQDSDIKVDVDRSVLDAILKKIKEKEEAEAGDSPLHSVLLDIPSILNEKLEEIIETEPYPSPYAIFTSCCIVSLYHLSHS